jgi:hypothetical protein
MTILQVTQLSLHDVDIFYPFFTVQCQWFIFAFVVSGVPTYGFVGHL